MKTKNERTRTVLFWVVCMGFVSLSGAVTGAIDMSREMELFVRFIGILVGLLLAILFFGPSDN